MGKKDVLNQKKTKTVMGLIEIDETKAAETRASACRSVSIYWISNYPRRIL